MSDAPDPLGKRALYWAPAQRQEEAPRYPDEGDVPGKHALYSDAVATPSRPVGRARVRPPEDEPASGRAGHPSNRRLPSDRRRLSPSPPPFATPRVVGSPDDLERPPSGMFGSLVLQCSSCRVRSHVDLLEFVVLHLPLWMWRPGRGYTQFMTCPACRRRTWLSASWTSWSR